MSRRNNKIRKYPRKDLAFHWLTDENGEKWEEWRSYAEKWMREQSTTADMKRLSLCKFFNEYLLKKADYSFNVKLFFEGRNGHFCSTKELLKVLKINASKAAYHNVNRIVIFVDWVIEHYFSTTSKDGTTVPSVKNPFERITKGGNYHNARSKDLTFQWLTGENGGQWEEWRSYAEEWMREQHACVDLKRISLCKLFDDYLLKKAAYSSNVILFFEGHKGHSCSTEELQRVLKKKAAASTETHVNRIVNFVDWAIEHIFPITNEDGTITPSVKNPFKRIHKGNGAKRDGRSSDMEFLWFTKAYGDQWEQWRRYAATWLKDQHTATEEKLKALCGFFDRYLVAHANYSSNIELFFTGYKGHICTTDEFLSILKKTINYSGFLTKLSNHSVDFVDWIIEQDYSEELPNGLLKPLYVNPLTKVYRNVSYTETCYNPLPYKYIVELRNILCPKPENGHFEDWEWAYGRTGNGTQSGDWVELAEGQKDLIDKNDPDCVWKVIKRRRSSKFRDVYFVWSPVAAMAVFLKLHLPVRLYQVRMLDSGEADTWRYEKGEWVHNKKHLFVQGSIKTHFSKGIFKRHYDHGLEAHSTGLYFNTNKTSDRNKDELDRGYTIPWQHEIVLYWLEKLRNWQEKYNPIEVPTDPTTLKKKHTGSLKSEQSLSEMGSICFLFRSAQAKNPSDREKPITTGIIERNWYQLLLELEERVFQRGVTINGQRLKFVSDYPDDSDLSKRTSTRFPLHSLRVSLITAYTMDTNVPLPVISKLLAGHSRILMTIYYNKLTPTVMAQKMREAEQQLRANEQESLQAFLTNAEIDQLASQVVYHCENSVKRFLETPNPAGWEQSWLGVCLVGGNTHRIEHRRAGGCWNGGLDILKDATAPQNRVHSEVPHGPKNCIRCRWFISDASYLPSLVAHHHLLSSRLAQERIELNKLSRTQEALKNEEFQADQEDLPFLKQGELNEIASEMEATAIEIDELLKDMLATHDLISRLIDIENTRNETDNSNKLVVVGEEADLRIALEDVSEFTLQAVVCENAEFYPAIRRQVNKMSTARKLSEYIDRARMDTGLQPVFLTMDEDQRLLAVNAFIRNMLKYTKATNELEGLEKVGNYLEAKEYLQNNELLAVGFDALDQFEVQDKFIIDQYLDTPLKLKSSK